MAEGVMIGLLCVGVGLAVGGISIGDGLKAIARTWAHRPRR